MDRVRSGRGNILEVIDHRLPLIGLLQAQTGAILDDHQRLPEPVVHFGGESFALLFLGVDQAAREHELFGVFRSDLRDAPLEKDQGGRAGSEGRQRHKPPGAVERRQNDNIQRRALLVPDVVAIGGDHAKRIVSRWDVREIRETARPRVDPIVVEPLEFVFESQMGRVDERQCGVVDLEIVL